MTVIHQITLRVTDPARQVRFYCDTLGMQNFGEGCVGYGGEQAVLQFLPADAPYVPERSDLYWKIALSVPDLDLAYDQMCRAGVPCSEPRQFEDVGYLAHIADPEGFAIELIDHAFQGERGNNHCDPKALGGGAHLSLLTLRTADIEAIEPDLLAAGMQKLSVQPLHAYGFTLHFYGKPDDCPPDPQLTAIANRTWVYQRPYTVLEIQHVHDLDNVTLSADGAAGFVGANGPSVPSVPLLGLDRPDP